TVGPRTISPGAAACWSRAAMLTASPVTNVDSASSTTTSPASTPTRASRPRSRTCSSTENAARRARSASSAWVLGTPNAAITASPADFSTVPPNRSMHCDARSKYSFTRRRTISGSALTTKFVESTRSTNTTVASLRSKSPDCRERATRAGSDRVGRQPVGEGRQHLELDGRHVPHQLAEGPVRDDQQQHGPGGRDGRRARPFRDQCDLAEEVARSERADLAAVPADVRCAVDEHEELAARIALTRQDLARGHVDLVGDPGDLAELLLRAAGKERNALQKLGFRIAMEH